MGRLEKRKMKILSFLILSVLGEPISGATSLQNYQKQSLLTAEKVEELRRSKRSSLWAFGRVTLSMLRTWQQVSKLLTYDDDAFPGLDDDIRRTSSTIDYMRTVADDIKWTCDIGTQTALFEALLNIQERMNLITHETSWAANEPKNSECPSNSYEYDGYHGQLCKRRNNVIGYFGLRRRWGYSCACAWLVDDIAENVYEWQQYYMNHCH